MGKGSLALLTLNRPRNRNRVNLAMAMEIRQACQRMRQDNDVRVAILTGAGGVFSVGRERGLLSRASQRQDPQLGLEAHRAASALAQVEVPTIAALNGDAIDQGLELALACDLRVAEEGIALGFTDLSRCIIPWDGGTQRLPRLVGCARALEMLLTGRLIGAQEALQIGLVNMVVAPKQALRTAEELAGRIAAGGPTAVRFAKEAVLKGLDLTLDQGLQLEADLSFILQATQDRAEGLRSFFEKRPPRFTGR